MPVSDARPPTIGSYTPSRQLLIVLCTMTIVCDQATKAAVRSLVPIYDSVTVIPGVVQLVHVRNTGAAFGLLNAVDIPFKPAIMTMIALSALIAIIMYATRSPSQAPLARFGIALVIGGAIGNLIDRMTIGHVVDFVDVYWREWHFWAFNVADAAITVGAGFLVLDMLTSGLHVSEAA